jgi:hypothetical protein
MVLWNRIAEGWRGMSTPRKIRRVFMLGLLGVGIWALMPYFFSRQVSEGFPAGGSQAATAPQALLSGDFTRVDPVHAADGTATIYRLPDGSRVLRLEGFKVTNGPDLFVSLSGHPMPRNRVEVHDRGYLEIQALKANEGDQNYELPADLNLDEFKAVVIYCRAFSFVFSTAELAPAA